MKKIYQFIIILIIIVFNVVNAKSDYSYFDFNNLDLKIKATNVLLYNLDDELVIYEQNSEEKISIASLTKIMTSIIAIEKNIDLDKEVTISKNAFNNISGYATAGFKVNERVTIRDLVYGTLLPSGAEAAQELAILTSGNIEDFVSLMNEYKDKLNLNNTNFSNPIGKDDENNYSTLEDLKKLLLYALKNETFYQVYTTRYYKTTNNLELYSTLVPPSEKYFLDIDNIKGSKSGFTKNAGLCLSSIASINNVNYLLIITNSLYQNNYPNHIVDSLSIYKYFSDNYGYENIINKDKELFSLKVEDGYINNYSIYSNQDYSLYINKNINDLSFKYEGIETINRNIKINSYLGKVNVIYQDKVIYSYDVYLKDNLKYKYTDYKIIMGISLVFLIIILVLRKKKRKKKRRH